jgi:methylenetetrahydrofolate dehydrogenase (NADP+) / methenyltetrahydrofolate cyclohydrolase
MHEAVAARLLEGSGLAARIRAQARAEVERLGPPAPGLRVLLLGNDPASESYVGSKTRAAREAGCLAETVRLAAATPPEGLLAEIDRANQDAAVDGVLVQFPLGPGHDVYRVFDRIDPRKDVDGMHPENTGLLHQGRPRFIPCTPAGILALLDDNAISIAGRHAVILGRSEIVGKPLAALMTLRDATVTVCHSKTRDLAAICRQAEILVSAIGRPGFVTPEFVAHGATVIDVGINRVTKLDEVPPHLRQSKALLHALEQKGKALVGDVDFDRVSQVAGAITPVPGGVGPLTVAMLLANTVLAARLRRGGPARD